MSGLLRIKSCLDFSKLVVSDFVDYVCVPCSMELSIKLEDNDWIVICFSHDYLTLREDVADKFSITGCYEEIIKVSADIDKWESIRKSFHKKSRRGIVF